MFDNAMIGSIIQAFAEAGLSERILRMALLMTDGNDDAMKEMIAFVKAGGRCEQDVLAEGLDLMLKYEVDDSQSQIRDRKRRDEMDNDSIIIVHSDSEVGYMKMSGVDGGLISLNDYPFDATTLPQEMTERAFLEDLFKTCPANEPWSAETIRLLLKHDWSRHKKVTVWINDSVNSMIASMFIAKIYDGPLYILDYSKFVRQRDEIAVRLDSLDCDELRALVGREMEVTDEYRQYLRDRWDELVRDGRALKVLDESGKVKCVDVDDLKPMLQSVIPADGIKFSWLIKPMYWAQRFNGFSFIDRAVLDGLRAGLLKARWLDTGEEVEENDIPDGLSLTFNNPQVGYPDPRVLSHKTVTIHLA